MTSSVLLFLHEALCLVLWYTIFCRSVKTDKRVRADVRAAFVLLGYVALAGVVAPLAWAWEPDAWGLALLAAIIILQLVTDANWAHGVPDGIKRHVEGLGVGLLDTGGTRPLDSP